MRCINRNQLELNISFRKYFTWLSLLFFFILISQGTNAQSADDVLNYLRKMGDGSYLFGQMGTWVHNENPDMDDPSNWIRKVYDHTGRLPLYGCITYDFHDNPFPDSAWNKGVKKISDRGMIAGVFSFYANPSGGSWNDSCDIDQILEPGDNEVKRNFYRQMDRMAANMQWLKEKK